MIKSVAILRESKVDIKGRECESRVILTPSLIEKLKKKCPQVSVFVEDQAGARIDATNVDYENVGAEICSHDEALTKDLILGVKETKVENFPKLGSGIWMSFQHFANSVERTKLALKTNTTFVALETMEEGGTFPCLAPMSEAAGRIIARHADMYALLSRKIITSGETNTGMHGVKVTIIGGGVVGKTAAEEFSAHGSEVILLEKDEQRLRELNLYFQANKAKYSKVAVLPSNAETLKSSISNSFFVVSGIYIAGKKPPKLVTIDLLKLMEKGGCAYAVDCDQGGGIEGITETSILDPFDLPPITDTEIKCFAAPNIPSMGARTTSKALGTAILPYVVEIINKGLKEAAEENTTINSGINIAEEKIAHQALAQTFPAIMLE